METLETRLNEVARILPGQLRGVPWMANALVRLWELDQYDDTELLRKKFSGSKMAGTSARNNNGPRTVAVTAPSARSNSVPEGEPYVDTQLPEGRQFALAGRREE